MENLPISTNTWVFDLESDNLRDEATVVWCGCFLNIQTKEMYRFRPDEIAQMLVFMDTTEMLIGHNCINFDFPLLEKLHNYRYKGKKYDTLLVSRLLNPKRQVPHNCPNKKCGGNSVEAWGWRVGRGKVEHNDWSVFSEEMLHRCSEDVEIQLLIYNALLEEAKKGDYSNAFPMTFKLFEYLQKQESYGWAFDSELAHRNIHQLTHWIERIDKVLYKHLPLIVEIDEQKKEGEYGWVKKPFLKSGDYSASVKTYIDLYGLPEKAVCGPFSRISFRRVNLNSGDETKQFLLNSGWIPLEWNTNDEGERTSPKLSKDDPFEGIQGSVGRLVAKRVQARHRRSTIEGLLEKVREDGRIPAVIKQLADTSRAIHSNVVNIPKVGSFYGKQMRKLFTSKDGFVLVGTDSDADQIRKLAGRMNDPEYTESVVNGDKSKGTDIHTVNKTAAGLKSRDVAKTFFYGFIFGAGNAKIGKIVGGTSQDGERLKAEFLAGLPALGNLLDALTKEWRATAKKRFNAKWNRIEYYDGTIKGLDGRPTRIPYEHQLLVYMLQSDEAIAMSAAYIKVNIDLEKKYKYGEDYGVVGFYHDEYTIECRPEIAEDVKLISEQAITWANAYFNIPCFHVGHGAIGKNWYDIH